MQGFGIALILLSSFYIAWSGFIPGSGCGVITPIVIKERLDARSDLLDCTILNDRKEFQDMYITGAKSKQVNSTFTF